MHHSNPVWLAFVFGILPLNAPPLKAEDFVSYLKLVRDTFNILTSIVASNLLVFVIGDELLINDLLHVEQHVPTKH